MAAITAPKQLMQTILRTRFPDTPLDALLLESAAGLWLEWHLQARTARLFPGHSFHRVEAHLWGVPRPDIEACRVRLFRRATQELPDSSVVLSDPDTLTVTSPWREIPQPAALARVAALFGGEEFEGMRLTLRFTAGEWRGTPDGRPLSEATLVIWSELRGGVPRLKGTWPADLSGRGETGFHFAPWISENQFWQAVSRFGKSREALPCPERLFISPAWQHVRRAARWLQVDVGEQRTLGAFLARVATFGTIAALSFSAMGLSPSVPTILLVALPGLLSLRWLLRTIFRKVKNVANFHDRMKTRLREVYSQPLNFLAVDLAEAGRWPEASTAKYTREAEQMGCVHWRDMCRTASAGIQSFYRTFALPSQRTYIFLTLMHSTGNQRPFPAKAWFMATTYFTDGTRLLLTNEQGGYSRTRDRLVVQRFFPQARDLAALLEMSQPIVQRLIAGGKELLPMMSPDELLARMETDHERASELARRAGYFTWGAAIRQSFHLTRREYRSRL
ncbi:MAG: hypothetical protein ACM3U2_18220 [Deltaproteobacteria bacterium]